MGLGVFISLGIFLLFYEVHLCVVLCYVMLSPAPVYSVDASINCSRGLRTIPCDLLRLGLTSDWGEASVDM